MWMWPPVVYRLKWRPSRVNWSVGRRRIGALVQFVSIDVPVDVAAPVTNVSDQLVLVRGRLEDADPARATRGASGSRARAAP